jgi:uncharacterized protein involved in exopolysaccharide biosynthesis
MSRSTYPPPDRSPAFAPSGREPDSGLEREPSLKDYFESSRPYLRRAAWCVVLGILVSAGVAFLWPPTYKATTTLLPPTEEDTGFNAASVFRGLSVPGIRIPSRSGPEDVAVVILHSRRIADTLVQRFHLIDVYHVKSDQAAVAKLQKRSKFKVDESGSVIITVADRESKRAADLANAYAEEVDRFNREIRMTKGRRMRLFVEGRLAETRKDLATAEQALRDYGMKHKAIALSPDELSTVESAAQLFASKSALETRLGMTREYASENSEEVRRLREQLDTMNGQIAALPELGLELARMVRDVKIQEQVFSLLSAQYEEARINEARDVPTVEVLDSAIPPEHRSWPRRGLLIGIGGFLSLCGALAWIAWSVRRTGVVS